MAGDAAVSVIAVRAHGVWRGHVMRRRVLVVAILAVVHYFASFALLILVGGYVMHGLDVAAIRHW